MVLGGIAWLIKKAPKGIAFLGGSFLPALVFTQVLRFNPFMPEALKSIGVLASVVLFGAGVGAGLYYSDWRVVKYTGPLGALVPTGVLVMSLVLSIGDFILPVIGPEWVFSLATIALLLGVIIYSEVSSKDPKEESTVEAPSIVSKMFRWFGLEHATFIGAIEVVEYPESHLQDNSRQFERMDRYSPFLSVLRGMRSGGLQVGFRMERAMRKNRMFYLTRAPNPDLLNESLDALESVLSTHLRSYRLERIGEYVPDIDVSGKTCFSTRIEGEPLSIEDLRQSTDGLTAAVETLHEMDNGIIQVWADPLEASWLEKWSARNEFEAEDRKRSRTRTRTVGGILSGGGQQSFIEVDTSAATKAGRLNRRLVRVTSEDSVELGVFTTSWDSRPARAERNATLLGHSIVSSFHSADYENVLKVKPLKKRRDSIRLLKGHPVGRPTQMLATEAAVFFIPSRRHIGISTSRRYEFSTVSTDVSQGSLSGREPKLVASRTVKNGDERWDLVWNFNPSEMVMLGHIIRANGEVDRSAVVAFDPLELERHMLILGTTRSGKTTTGLTIAGQLIRLGIFPIIIVPYKVRDWRVLKSVYPNIRIFTAGNPDIAPLRINIWVPPEGVRIDKWIMRLAEIFHAWFPSQEVVSLHMRRIIMRTYELCEWDVANNIQGRPVLLEDLLAGIEYALEMGDVKYSADVKENFVGALKARLEAMLTYSTVVDMFNTAGGITINELLETPHIIEMESLHKDVKQLLIGVLAAGLSEYRMASPLSSVENVLILEEAHAFLKKAVERSDGQRTAAQEANASLSLMLRTSGGNGLGIVISDHLPSQMAPEAVKMPNNHIMHKQSQGSEAEIAGDLVRLDTEKSKHLTGMDPGEVILVLEGHKNPRNVKITQLQNLVVVPLNKDNWTNERVRKEMQTFFAEHHERLRSEPLSAKTKKQLGLTSSYRGEYARLRRIIETPEMEVVFQDIVRRAELGDTKLAVAASRKLAQRLGTGEEERVQIAIAFLKIARERYAIPEEDAIFTQMIGDVGEAAA